MNAGHIARHKLLEDHMPRHQQAISGAAIAAGVLLLRADGFLARPLPLVRRGARVLLEAQRLLVGL
jgi:hypothetical protein